MIIERGLRTDLAYSFHFTDEKPQGPERLNNHSTKITQLKSEHELASVQTENLD